MRHHVELEVAECDLLHLAIRGMILDPVKVTAEPVSGMQHRRVPVGNAGKFVQASAGELPQPLVLRRQAVEDLSGQINC
jgi:hypothetical protein